MGNRDYGLKESGAKGKGEEEEELPFPLTEVDRWVLSQTDEEFHLHDWEELKVIIGKYCLCLDLRRPRLVANSFT